MGTGGRRGEGFILAVGVGENEDSGVPFLRVELESVFLSRKGFGACLVGLWLGLQHEVLAGFWVLLRSLLFWFIAEGGAPFLLASCFQNISSVST